MNTAVKKVCNYGQKKKHVAIIAISFLTLVSSCAKKTNGIASSDTTLSIQNSPNTELVSLSELPLSKNLTSKDQPYWESLNHNITKGVDCYYYIDYIKNKPRNNHNTYFGIYYLSEDGQTDLLCSNPECQHANSNCVASLESSSNSSEENFNGQNIYYHNGNIYIFATNTYTRKNYLYKVDAKGLNREKLFEIDTDTPASSLVFHENNVYIYQRESGASLDDKIVNIRKRSLYGKEDEICFLSSDQNYIYLSNFLYHTNFHINPDETIALVLDKSGNELKKIVLAKSDEVYFGDDDYFFIKSKNVISYCKKENILSDTPFISLGQ